MTKPAFEGGFRHQRGSRCLASDPASRADAGLESALPAVAIALAAMTAGQVLTAAARHRARLLPALAAQAAQEMLAAKAVALDLQALETPAFHDRLVRAQHEAAYRPANMVTDLARIVSPAVAVIGLGGLLLAVHDELMAAGGHYAELFGLQAAAYTTPVRGADDRRRGSDHLACE